MILAYFMKFDSDFGFLNGSLFSLFVFYSLQSSSIRPKNQTSSLKEMVPTCRGETHYRFKSLMRSSLVVSPDGTVGYSFIEHDRVNRKMEPRLPDSDKTDCK